MNSDRIIALSATGTFAIGFVDSFVGKESHGEFPSPYHARLFVGTGLAFIGCAALAELSSDLGASFALLIFTVALTTKGGDTVSSILNLVGKV